jgi:hypothetical protein
MSCISLNQLPIEIAMDTTTKKTQRMRATLPEELSLVYTEETELHWQRIITAILVVLALLTAIGWILMNSISAEKAAQVISAKPEVEETGSEASEKAGVKTSGNKSPAAAEIEPKIQQLDNAVPSVPNLNEGPPGTPQDQPQTATPNLAVKVLPLYAHMPDKPMVSAAPPPVGGKFLETPRKKEDAAQITRNPFYIGSLQLTSRLKNKSPTDLLGAEITLGDRQLVKVYAYSELTNLKGEKVFHVWYQGDKRMARIPVGVYLDDMRASTSKYIDQTMGGDWHLEITRANGEQLGRMDFRVNADS